jgi:cytochrome c oxidase subunit 1
MKDIRRQVIAQTGAAEPAYMTAMEAGRIPGDGH